MKTLIIALTAATITVPALAQRAVVIDPDTVTCATILTLDADDRAIVMQRLEAEIPMALTQGEEREEMEILREAVFVECEGNPGGVVRDLVTAMHD